MESNYGHRLSSSGNSTRNTSSSNSNTHGFNRSSSRIQTDNTVNHISTISSPQRGNVIMVIDDTVVVVVVVVD